MPVDPSSPDPITTDPLGRHIPADTPEEARVEQRRWFYDSLPPAAKDRFLEALKAAQERGASQDAAWEDAVVAAETAYPTDPDAAPDAPPPRLERDG